MTSGDYQRGPQPQHTINTPLDPYANPVAAPQVTDYQQPAIPMPPPYGTPPSGYQAPAPIPAPAAPYPGGWAMDPAAPYGRDPFTGEPLSDKSKIAAGLLQLFLGTLGIGRFYMGDGKTGGIQLGLTIFGLLTLLFVIGGFLITATATWAFIDALMLLIKGGHDARGLKLR